MIKSNNKAKFITLFSLLLFMSGFMLAACSQEETEDANKEVIIKVLEHQFTGPDEKFVELVWNPKYRTVVNNKEENKELDKYVEEVYGPYFIDSYISSFLAASGTTYPIVAHLSGNKLSLKDIMIEQSEKMANRYTFVVTVGYQKNGEEEKTANVSGEVIFSTKKEGKIGRFQYRDEDGLVNNIMNDMNN